MIPSVFLKLNFFFRLFSWTKSIEFVKLANIKISFVIAICFKVQRNLSISSQFSQGLPIFQEKRIQSVKGSLSQIQEGTVNMYSLVVRCIFNAPQKPFMGMAQKLSPNQGTANHYGRLTAFFKSPISDSFCVFIYNIIIYKLTRNSIFTSLST